MNRWLKAVALQVPVVRHYVERHFALVAELQSVQAEHNRVLAERRQLLEVIAAQTADLKAQLSDLSVDLLARTGDLGADLHALNGDIHALNGDLKSDLHALTADLNADLHALNGDLKSDLHALNGDLKSDLHTLTADLNSDLHSLTGDLSNDLHALSGDLKKDIGVGTSIVTRIMERGTVEELWYQDLLAAIARPDVLPRAPNYVVTTQSPVATSSDDHRFPWGTAMDNTRWPRFVQACERLVNRKPLRMMDLGCAGGGLVLDFLLAGHSAVGIEGSDFSRINQRATWRIAPFNLFTADITQPFNVSLPGGPQTVPFDIITAWDVMEHIEESDLDTLFANVSRHLREDGYFIGTIAVIPDVNPETGAVYHRTVKPRSWWSERYAKAGLKIVDLPQFAFDDFARGIGNPFNRSDGDYRKLPEVGFHFIAMKRKTG